MKGTVFYFLHYLCNTEESKETGWREQNRPNRSCLQPTEWTILFFKGTRTSPQNMAAGWMLYLSFQTSKMPLGCVRQSRWKRIVDIRSYKKDKAKLTNSSNLRIITVNTLPFYPSPVKTSPGSVCLLWFIYIFLTYFISYSFDRHQIIEEKLHCSL